LPLVITSAAPKSASSRCAHAAAQEDDRTLPRLEQLPLGLAGLREQLWSRRHQGERLVLAVLARAQARDGVVVVGGAGEVPAAEPLDGQDRAVAQQLDRLLER
jgi:hypothetical protein